VGLRGQAEKEQVTIQRAPERVPFSYGDQIMEDSKSITRRELLARSGQVAAGIGLAAALGNLPAGAAEKPTVKPRRTIGANDRIVVACIGTGGMGRANLNGFLDHQEVDVAAVCDLDTRHMAEAAKMVQDKRGKRPAEIKDFRRVLEMNDIDAVVISTTDHWHALPFIYACQTGKDVFVEKPISHNITEGQQMVNAARRYKAVTQVNTWQRSTQHFIDAIDYVRSGKLGKITVVRSWKTDNARMGRKTPSSPPAELDYDFWVGPAVYEPYRENRCHYNFRWYFNYAAGMTGDWGVHMIDIALLGMAKSDSAEDMPQPSRVAAWGGKFGAPDDDRTTPDTHIAIFQYPDYILQWETHAGSYGMDGGGDHGTEFIGTDARLMIDRGGWKVIGQDGSERPKEESPRKVADHIGNFLSCIRTRETARADVAALHVTTTLCHLANLAYLADGSFGWDGKEPSVRKAMDLLPYRRTYRKPWSLPKITV